MPALHEQVKTLKKTTTTLKRENTRLANANAKLNKIISEYGPQADIKDLKMQLEASQEHVDVLQQRTDEQTVYISELRTEIACFQSILANTAAVSMWRTQPELPLSDPS